jgi:hypothetical protein
MNEQSGQSEPADRQPRSGSSRGDQRRNGGSGPDLLGDLQRWLIRSSARNMRKELEDQVRRTIGGQRQERDRGDVWDVATTEIPPEVGEAPECQWCPICRAARRMRDSGPGLGGQLSGAGEAVSTAVQDAISALDSLLARTGGRGAGAGGPEPGGTRGTGGSARARPTGAGRGPTTGAERGPTAGNQAAEPAEPSAARPDSLAGEHGQVGWKPGDRLATAGPAGEDSWAAATDSDTAVDGADSGGAADPPDGRGHGPSDRS